MPIPIAPTPITATVQTTQTVTATKLHVDRLLTQENATRTRPSLSLTLTPYAQPDENDLASRQFGQPFTLQTADLYAALANLAAVGLTLPQQALGAIFAAVPQFVAYKAARKAEMDQYAEAETTAKATLDAAEAADPVDKDAVAAAKTALEAAQAKATAARLAWIDPANPRVTA